MIKVELSINLPLCCHLLAAWLVQLAARLPRKGLGLGFEPRTRTNFLPPEKTSFLRNPCGCIVLLYKQVDANFSFLSTLRWFFSVLAYKYNTTVVEIMLLLYTPEANAM